MLTKSDLDNYCDWWAKMVTKRLRWNYKVRRMFAKTTEKNGYMTNFDVAKSKVKKIGIG